VNLNQTSLQACWAQCGTFASRGPSPEGPAEPKKNKNVPQWGSTFASRGPMQLFFGYFFFEIVIFYWVFLGPQRTNQECDALFCTALKRKIVPWISNDTR
jgi:hypothetical protein